MRKRAEASNNVQQIANFNSFIDSIFKFMPKTQEKANINDQKTKHLRGNSLTGIDDNYTDTEDEKTESSENSSDWSIAATCRGRKIKQKIKTKNFRTQL